jgi:hypothetical protein
VTTTLATGLPDLDLEGEATMVVDANDASAVLTKVTIHLRAGAPPFDPGAYDLDGGAYKLVPGPGA